MPIQFTTAETRQIADQLRRLYDGPSWLGPSVKELIGDVDEERARYRPLAGAHTIGELVLHITAWLRISRERLSSEQPRDAEAAENWPGMDQSWKDVLSSLDFEISALEESILSFPVERLQDQAPASEAQTFYQLLHGVIQHSAYHAGQVALLKKLA